MRPVYAQTNVQLFNQLQREHYSVADLTTIHRAYELAAHLYTGYFIGSGRTQIAHVIGAASILACLRLPAEMVAAGLIHNAYVTGDFGDGIRGISDVKRHGVQRAVGGSVEAYVYRFPVMKSEWLRGRRLGREDSDPSNYIDRLDTIDRQTLLIVLADELEHALNLEEVHRKGSLDLYVAAKLGYPQLGEELERAVSRAKSVGAESQLISKALGGPSRIITPRSYCRRPGVVFRQKVNGGCHRVASALRLRKTFAPIIGWASAWRCSFTTRAKP